MALFDDELRKAQQQRAMYNAQLRANQAQADYDALMPQAMAKINQAQQGPSNPLESVLSGIGNSIKNVGTGLMDLFGTGGAAVGDAFESIRTGKATTKNQDDYRKWLYNTDSVKDAATKGLGTGLDAAATLTDFIPGLGTATKVGLNIGQGVASGIANPLIEKGSQATLEDAMKGALVGGASAGVGQYVGGKLANRAAGKGLISKALNSNVGKGAITGGLAGATGGGLYAGLNGGDVLGGALQGAQGGAMAGGTMAGAMGVLGSGIDRLNRKYNAEPQTPDIPATKPIVDEVAEQYTKPATIETALQEAPTPAPVYRTSNADVAPETAENSSLIGRALRNAGNDLQAAQTNITRAERRKFGIKDAGETVNTLRKRTGFSNLDDQAEFAKNITGGQNSIMDDILRYNISVDESGKPITLRTDQYEVAINDAVGKEWKKSVMGKDYDQFRKDLIADIQNQDPITAANWLKREAATQRGIAEGKGPTADKAARKAKIYTEVANKVDDLTYSAVPQKNINRMFDDTIDEFKTRASEAKAAGNKKYADAYERLADELSKTERTIAKYRSFKKDFVKSSQLAEISRGAQSGSLEAGYKRGNVIGRVVNTIAEEPINRALAFAGGKLSDIGDAVDGSSTGMAGKAAGKAGKVAGKAAEMLNNDTFSGREISPITRQGQTQTIGDVAMRRLPRQVALDTMREQDRQNAIQNATQEAQDIQSNYENSMLQAQQAYNQAQQAQAAAMPSALDRISAGMERALAAGDIDAYGKLASLYKQAAQMYELQNPTTTKSEAKALSANQSKAMAGLQQLQDLRGMQPGVRTALANTPLAGLVDMTGGDEYTNQAKSLALTLGYLQSGANITPREAENIGRAYIPSAYDSDQVRQQKLSRAEQLLRNYLADTSSLPQ